MRRVVLGALLAAAALAASVGAASANRLSISPETGFRVRYPSWEVQFGYEETNVKLTCSMTLEGSFHTRTFAKVASALIGYVTRATVAEASCSNRVGPRGEGEWPGLKARFLSETLPWHLRYSTFSGVLPAISNVAMTLVGFAPRITELPFAGSCLYRSTATAPLPVSLALGPSGEVTSFDAGGENVPLSSGSALCSEHLQFAGDNPITQLTTTALLTVRLI